MKYAERYGNPNCLLFGVSFGLKFKATIYLCTRYAPYISAVIHDLAPIFYSLYFFHDVISFVTICVFYLCSKATDANLPFNNRVEIPLIQEIFIAC